MSENANTKDRDTRSPDDGTSAPHSDLDDFLCFAVYEANLAFNHLYRSLLEEIGLTYPQYLVMTLLWRQNERTVKEIGEALSLEYNTLTPMIKRLETMGLVTRVRDRVDQRVVKVSLTKAGSDLEERARQVPECVAEASGLSQKAFNDLKASLTELRSNIRKTETH
ncbi:MAG: MarR family transcriptional regulator [Roseibium sp.]|uniref:MarR family winged helix-turn-helix transcriptional regulator n=1 Tax=Roseibium sp. TaxID=1936156 RepID=UPI0026181194|nr:MarR family transcriptional regulator [Roseibium sp.]MCV0427794.1 MarR family transcriptional regulator [Roseibium sp.]